MDPTKLSISQQGVHSESFKKQNLIIPPRAGFELRTSNYKVGTLPTDLCCLPCYVNSLHFSGEQSKSFLRWNIFCLKQLFYKWWGLSHSTRKAVPHIAKLEGEAQDGG